ncbi:VOC family protein [Georgenia sp. SYP-B2076]|uniref:VOC family protein n=1 Tax=Georgenia sp. SYP-B2076 TaxID=2495881 RepID=UPI000F8ECA51|nr:VOC family protein [Georgenia sp. SYP-B2076]
MSIQGRLVPRTYPPGVTCWVDTEQPDVEAACRFYGGLFGWTFENAAAPGAPVRYVIARLGGRDVGAVAGPRDGTATWNTYVAVDDADDWARRLVALGATVRSAPADAGEGGRGAVLADPEGVELRLWQPRRRLGAQAVNEPGAWNFSDLHTGDPEAATAFYAEAFGWSIEDVGFGRMIRRPGYGDHLEATSDPDIRARQSAVSTPPGFEDAIGWLAPIAPGETPHWHVSFAVADRDRTAADAERLGGHVLDAAETEWTRTALLRDPQGAEFTASQFTPPSR